MRGSFWSDSHPPLPLVLTLLLSLLFFSPFFPPVCSRSQRPLESRRITPGNGSGSGTRRTHTLEPTTRLTCFRERTTFEVRCSAAPQPLTFLRYLHYYCICIITVSVPSGFHIPSDRTAQDTHASRQTGMRGCRRSAGLAWCSRWWDRRGQHHRRY